MQFGKSELLMVLLWAVSVCRPNVVGADEKAEITDDALRTVLTEAVHNSSTREKTDKSASEDLTVKQLESLRFLNAEGREIQSLQGLEHCRQLTELNLARNQIADITPLAGCEHLRVLRLNQNRVRSAEPLSTLQALMFLNIADNEIDSTESLRRLSDLKVLIADRNRIASVAPLAGLPHLHSLFVADNRLTDTEGLSKCPDLAALVLSDNEISDVTGLTDLQRLRRLFLNGNPITDLHPLETAAWIQPSDSVLSVPGQLYLSEHPPDSAIASQTESMRKLGVRVTIVSP